MFDQSNQNINKELKCKECGAHLTYNPGTESLKCSYCGTLNIIASENKVIEELDYNKFLNNTLEKEEKIEVATVKCSACGAVVSLQEGITSDKCPYCASSIVVTGGSNSSVIKPKSVIPFIISKSEGRDKFKSWLKGLWFAPNRLKTDARNGKLNGMYIPYWTYDTDTASDYTGQRGDYYYVTETYTEVENGQSVTKTRQVRKTRWSPASGHVQRFFDDVLVIASSSLPQKFTDKLEPWNLAELKNYNDKYLSGFRTETYTKDIKTGFSDAKNIMSGTIKSDIRSDIGGDEQRISSVNTSYSNIKFKHILLPLWISSYKFNSKVYRFLINGQSGEVQGERPYSFWKILFAVLTGLSVVGAFLLFTN